MNDEELRKQLSEIREYVEALAKTAADQQVLTIRMMATYDAHLAAMRNLLIRLGEDRATLRQRLQSAYETALLRHKNQLDLYFRSGDAKAFLSSPIFPDEIEEN